MKKKLTKIMIGSTFASKGGITSVLHLYEQAGFFENGCYLASAQNGSAFLKIFVFISFLTQLVWTMVRHQSVQIVHMHVSQRGSFVRKSIALIFCKLFGKKVIWHMHGSEFNSFYTTASPLYRKFIAMIVRKVDCNIALSVKRKQELIELIPGARVTVIYNPCLLQTKTEQSNHTEITPTRDVHFLFLGWFGHRKGVYDLIEAARLLNHPNVKISLFGDKEVDKVKDRVKQAGLQDHISVNTWISGDAKHQRFLDSDVLVLPSYNEGLPMAILEAMSYSLPVISTPVGGIAEAVHDGINGFLIQPGDTQALADKLRYFVEHPEQIQIMGAKGYEIAAKNFELSHIITQLETTYNKLSKSA